MKAAETPCGLRFPKVSGLRKVLLCLLPVLSLCRCTVIEDGSFLAHGDALPSFCVEADDGTLVTDDDFSSGFGLIAFFNTACPDCVTELDVLQRFHESHPDLRMLLVSREEDADSVWAYWSVHGYSMPFSAQKDRRVYGLFASHTIPRVYVTHDGHVYACFDDDPLATLVDLEKAVYR